MRLRQDTDIVEFLRKVGGCRGDVVFTTEENDVLNLRSTLSRYVFIMLQENTRMFQTSTVTVSDPRDRLMLAPFLED